MQTRPSSRYQFILVGLLSLNFGVVFFDRNALNFLMPFVQPDLGLNNRDVGLLAAGLSLTWAASGFFVGRYSDRVNKRKSLIIAATLVFSVLSFISGLASSFLLLFCARLLMGLAEGGVLPVSQSLIAAQVNPTHRGLAMGAVQNLASNLLGGFLAPLVLVGLATSYGWRSAFYFSGLPGLLTVLLIWLLVVEPPATGRTHEGRGLSVRTALRERNIVLCTVISVLMISYLVIGWSFLPLFLTAVRGFGGQAMGLLMATLGLMAAIGSFSIPALSDRVGRKPVMVLVPFIGVLVPLGAMFFDGPVWMLAVLFALGWTLNGTFALFMSAIPAETVGVRHTATALGLVLGISELLGGAVSPFVAGAAADAFGLQAPMWAMVGLCMAAGLVSFGLRETAPRVVGRRQGRVLDEPAV